MTAGADAPRKSRSSGAREAGVAALVAAAALSGCYTYVPATLETVPANREVRAYLTRRGLEALPPDVAGGRSSVTGIIVRREGDTLLLRAPVESGGEAFYRREVGQNVAVPIDEIIEIERRELHAFRTGLALAAAAGAATGAVLLIMDASGSPGPGPPEGPDLIRIPLFSVTPFR